MPRRKQPRRTDMKDIRSILRLTHESGLSVREVSERLGLSKSTVSTYLLRARIDRAFLARLVLGVVLDRGCAERHFGGGIVFLLRQNIALIDLDRSAQVGGFVTRVRQCQELGASDPYVPSLAILLDAKIPVSTAALVHFEKQPVPVLIGAGIRQGCLDRNCCEFAHRFTPTFFTPTPG